MVGRRKPENRVYIGLCFIRGLFPEALFLKRLSRLRKLTLQIRSRVGQIRLGKVSTLAGVASGIA